MGEQSSWTQRSGATPGRLVLIAVLAVVLVAVMYFQFGRSTTVAAPTSRRPVAARRAPSAAPSEQPRVTDTLEGVPTSLAEDAAWTQPSPESVSQYDPFALPVRFPQPRLATGGGVALGEDQTVDAAGQGIDPIDQAIEETQRRLDQMRQLGVKVILKQGDQYVALIGDQMIHVGDEINGFTVTDISPNGVRVERNIRE